MNESSFANDFAALTGHAPFPWQKRLYEHFTNGINGIPACCDIPTGLGKTLVIAIWLIALGKYPGKIPRRLVYVVNRRTVVDQTTDEVENLRRNLKTESELKSLRDQLGGLAISTLRGQFADNQEWSANPSKPAVICGTVDMIGSRLLFAGYRIGFKSKPLHAGFLGQDALLIHDEAHLEPAFQSLIESIAKEQQRGNAGGSHVTWPTLRVMALSATARSEQDEDTAAQKNSVLGLSHEDRQHSVVKKRIEATKRINFLSVEDENKGKELVDEIVKHALEYKNSGRAVLVFAHKVEVVEGIVGKLPKDATKQLTGTLRGLERNGLVKTPVFQRFLPAANRDKKVTPAEGTVYLVCTSAGEVGVNISADHLVCDLSTFDSMAQRFGRVNRFGEQDDTEIHVVHPTSFGKKDKSGEEKTTEIDKRRRKTLDLLKQLDGDASPHALGQLDAKARHAAFASEPTILPTSDILFDAWSLTTIREKMPGRPPVEPYLHGVSEWDPPQTQVAWREEVKLIKGDLVARFPPNALLEDYPLKPHELLKDRSDRVFKKLAEIAKRCSDDPAWLVSDDGAIEMVSLKDLTDKNRKNRINGLTVLLPPAVGGLSGGLLDGKAKPDKKVNYDVADLWLDEQEKKRRVRVWDDAEPPAGMALALIRTIDIRPDGEEFEPEDGESEGGAPARRFWRWYVRPRDADDVTLASIRPVTLDHHTSDVVARTKEIVAALQLPDELQEALLLAAELHDLGKRRELWQRGIGNPNPAKWYGKPGKPENGRRWRPRRLSSYRHEFGSLLDVLDPTQEHLARLERLPETMRELVLHIIAAHHGRARPHFPPDESIDPAPGSNGRASEQALETPRRFARLQRKYGRWGLAYLESLLRAADWAASADPSTLKEDNA